METSFEREHAERIVGKLTAVDRLIIHGHLSYFFMPHAFEGFLSRQGVLLKDFKEYVLKSTTVVKEHAMRLAAAAVSRGLLKIGR